MHGDKKNGANREAKTEQNTVKPKQVKKMQLSPHFVLRKAAQPPFIYESKNKRKKEENFVRNAGNIQRGIYAVLTEKGFDRKRNNSPRGKTRVLRFYGRYELSQVYDDRGKTDRKRIQKIHDARLSAKIHGRVQRRRNDK